MKKADGIYLRVSSKSQDTRSQAADLKRWARVNRVPFHPYADKATGRSMDRPAWNRLWADVLAGKIKRIVVWRLDRLGRTAAGLTKLFQELIERRVSLVSLREGFDLSTASGRLQAHILASVAEYEREVSRERQTAGIAAALAAGKTWGGRPAGSRNKAVEAKQSAVKSLHKSGKSVSEIARVTSLSRPTIYSLIGA